MEQRVKENWVINKEDGTVRQKELVANKEVGTAKWKGKPTQSKKNQMAIQQ